MRFTIRNNSTPKDSHRHCTVFANGANAGDLCLNPDEFVALEALFHREYGNAIERPSHLQSTEGAAP
jgi:hypothetical protein